MRIVICLAVLLGSFGCNVKPKKKPDETVEAKKAAGEAKKPNQTVQADQPGATVPVKKKWYEGGTLQKATLKEWSEATYENKLATASDFLAEFVESEELEVLDFATEMRPLAAELVAGIDGIYRSVRKQVPESDETSVATVANSLIQLKSDDIKAKLLRK